MRKTVLIAGLAALLILGCSRPTSVIWQRRYDSGQEDFGRAVACDGDDVIIGGTWRDTTSAAVVVDWELLRYDARGKLVWRRVYDSGEMDWLSDMMIDRKHNIIALGACASAATDSVKLLLVKFDRRGEVVWDRQFAFGLATQGVALALGPELPNLPVDSSPAGLARPAGTDNRILLCGSLFAGGDSADDDILSVCLDAAGNLVGWDTMNFGDDEAGQDMVCDRAGNTVVLANRVPVLAGNFAATADLIFVKRTPEGKVLWRRSYDSGDDDLYGVMNVDAAGGITAVVTSASETETKVRLLEYDADGGILRDKPYNGQPNPACMAAVQDAAGAVIGVGGAGADTVQRFFAFRCTEKWSADVLTFRDYSSGANDVAFGVALDQAQNIVIVGSSDPGVDADILILKLKNQASQNKPR